MRYAKLLLICLGIATIGMAGIAQDTKKMSQDEISASLERLEKEKKEIKDQLAADKAAADKAAKDAKDKAAKDKAAADKAAKDAKDKADKAAKDTKAAADKAAKDTKAAADKAAKDAKDKAAADKAAAEKALKDKAAKEKAAADKAAKDAKDKADKAAKDAKDKADKAAKDAKDKADKAAEDVKAAPRKLVAEELAAQEAAREAAEKEAADAKKQAESEKAAKAAADKAAKDAEKDAKKDADKGKQAALVTEEIPEAADDEVPETDAMRSASDAKKNGNYKNNKPLPYLVLVANNRIPKTIFADFMLTEYNIPHILLPANGVAPEADASLFFISDTKNAQSVIRITARQLSDFIAFLRPKQVIILGDTKYIHPAYRMAVPETIKTIEYSSSSWKVNAVSIDNMMGGHKMFDRYYSYLQQQEAAAKAAAESAE